MMKIQIDVEKERLQGAMEMAGTVCHELSQPMQSIYGFSETLLMNSSKEDQHYKKIKSIMEQVDRMGVVLGKLMEIRSYKTKSYYKNTKIIDIERS